MADGRRRRRRGSILKAETKIDYKNVDLLERFVDEGGRIQSRRKTRTSAKQQRQITRAIKRARHVALMPMAPQHRTVRRRRA
jgi:small subunit ribosomal protein S18